MAKWKAANEPEDPAGPAFETIVGNGCGALRPWARGLKVAAEAFLAVAES